MENVKRRKWRNTGTRGRNAQPVQKHRLTDEENETTGTGVKRKNIGNEVKHKEDGGGRDKGNERRDKEEFQRIREWTAEEEVENLADAKSVGLRTNWMLSLGSWGQRATQRQPASRLLCNTRLTHTATIQIFESFWTRSSNDPSHRSPEGDLTVEPCAVILSTRFRIFTGWFTSSVTGIANRISSNSPAHCKYTFGVYLLNRRFCVALELC